MKILDEYYYIIKVVADSGKKTYYKIGEALYRSRPESLVNKYSKFRSCQAEILAFERLPRNDKKRLNDKTIHRNIDLSKLKPADPIYIEHYTGETDGSNEFFELVDLNLNVIDYVSELVKSLSFSKFYTAGNQLDTKLDYGKDKKHLVTADILANYILSDIEAKKRLYMDPPHEILLIGQFDFDFIATIAMMNNIAIWHDSEEQKHEYTMKQINENITYIDTLEGLMNMNKHFDLIISNPPYGSIGANITDFIRENVDYDEFVNLLPVNDYKRNKTKDLFNYQSDMVAVNHGFTDASVTTHLAKIHKEKVNQMTVDEFERSQYIDKSLDKYFAENAKRSNYAIDSAICPYWHNGPESISNKLTFILGERDISSKRFPTNKNGLTYRWNVLKTATSQEIHIAPNDQLSYIVCKFRTEAECKNFTDFVYSNTAFMSKVFRAVNCDKMKVMYKVFPKVDWSHSWPVEDILKDYGYTDAEIKEVMDDLCNYRGLDD